MVVYVWLGFDYLSLSLSICAQQDNNAPGLLINVHARYHISWLRTKYLNLTPLILLVMSRDEPSQHSTSPPNPPPTLYYKVLSKC